MSGFTLGVIADDFTGATDVASMLVRSGMRTVQLIGVPGADREVPPADAIVVALKSRTTAPASAVEQSLAALRWLQRAGMRQCYFKYCSTFDSTPQGNIGPVTEALMDALGAPFTLACPAFPENGRTIFRGHLFVGNELLSDSGMRHHPLTPMHDANLVRVLQAQLRARRVGLIAYDCIARGAAAVRARADELLAAGTSVAITDAIDDAALRTLAEAAADWPLVTAGSGLALGLPEAYARRGWIRPDTSAARLDPAGRRAAVLSGSCSQATLAQIDAWRASGRPSLAIDPRALARAEPVTDAAIAWAGQRDDDTPVLIYASAGSEALQAVQSELGAARAGELVEHALAAIAVGLVDRGVQRLVVAGGETSGAVVRALGVDRLRIGAPICPGVPWTQAEGRALHLALKSGNFGGPGFFAEALAMGDGR